jgi:hypothetical protein
LKLVTYEAIEVPHGAVGQHTDVPITGPLAASREILDELCLSIAKYPGHTKVVSGLEGGGTDCNVDPVPILKFSARIALIEPKSTDQEQLSDVGLNRGVAPVVAAVRKTPNKGVHGAIYRHCDPGRRLSGPA